MTALSEDRRAPHAPASTPAARLRDFGRAPRIVALDIARGIAVLGMAAAHTVALPGELRWSDPSTWAELVSGRSSILFALLAGISIALMTGRERVPPPEERGRLRLRLVARGLVIFLIGLGLELLGSNVAVILTFYGAVYAVAVVFIGMRVRNLVLTAACLAALGPSAVAALLTVSPAAAGDGLSFVLQGTYSIVVWTALMLAGLALGRLGIVRRRTALLALGLGVILSGVGYAAGGLWAAGYAGESSSESFSSSSSSWSSDSLSWAEDDDMPEAVPDEDVDLTGTVCEDYGDGYLSCYPEEDKTSSDDSIIDEDSSGWSTYFADVAAADPATSIADAFLASSPHSGGTMEILGSGGLALAIVGLLLLMGSALRYALLPIAAIGSMPLTAYSAHVVAIWVVLGPGGWDQDSALFWWLAAGLSAACTAWAVLIGRGPLERLTTRAASTLSR